MYEYRGQQRVQTKIKIIMQVGHGEVANGEEAGRLTDDKNKQKQNGFGMFFLFLID